jgi:hypothetical protein
LDANGNTIGKQLTIQFANVPVVGNWTADFYEASQSIRGLLSGFIKTPRPLRLWAADFSAFDITASDQAFVAYNANALSFQPLPVALTAFGAWPRAAPPT